MYKINGEVPYNTSCIKNWKTESRFKNYLPFLMKEFENFPGNTVGCLMARNRERTTLGSAVHISPGYILTAAHNIYKKIEEESGVRELFAESITFYPLLEGDNVKVAIKGEAVAMHTDFYDCNTNGNKMHMDIALIKLELADYEAFFDILESEEQSIDPIDTNIMVFGYPGVHPYRARHMVLQNVRHDTTENKMITYKGAQLYQGQSGGAVCIRHFDEYRLIGIHTHAKKLNKTQINGGGVFLDNNQINIIKRWKKNLEELPQ